MIRFAGRIAPGSGAGNVTGHTGGGAGLAAGFGCVDVVAGLRVAPALVVGFPPVDVCATADAATHIVPIKTLSFIRN